MSRDILTVIQSRMGTFSKSQKLIGRYILDNYDKAAFMTAARMGQAVHTSESTVVRFAAERLSRDAEGYAGDDPGQTHHRAAY